MGQVRINRIPLDWGDVTPAWMTAAVSKRCPGAVVDTVRLVTNDDGTNRRARFALTYAQGSGPETVFVKAHAAGHRWVHFWNGNLFVEARLFQSGVPLGVDTPIAYTTLIEWLRLDFLIVMEDLTTRGADPRNAIRPLTVEQAANGLRGLARLHSAYWNFTAKSQPKLRWVKSWQGKKGFLDPVRQRVPKGLARLGQGAAGALPAADAMMDQLRRYLDSLAKGPQTLLHGDAHIGNTYLLPNGDVGFLDWTVRKGGWSQDVGYFLVGALTEADCRAHEAELIEVYRTALTIPEDQRPTREEAWLHYRASHIYGLAIWLATLGSDGWQSPEICTALATRYAAAFVAHGTDAALAALGA